jgi:hypothetical protein
LGDVWGTKKLHPALNEYFKMEFFIIGCASEPVKVDLPVNHLGNPLSNETAFTPPPNPFQKKYVNGRAC